MMQFSLELGLFVNGRGTMTLCNYFSLPQVCISSEKSSFLYNETTEEIWMGITALLPYKLNHIDEGFKYLGYHLKPSNYGTKGYRWLVKRFEKKSVTWLINFSPWVVGSLLSKLFSLAYLFIHLHWQGCQSPFCIVWDTVCSPFSGEVRNFAQRYTWLTGGSHLGR